MKTRLSILLLLFTIKASLAQTVFSENMGSPSGTTAIASNVFQNSSSLTYSGGGQSNSADVRATSPSSGYNNASGGGNVYFTTTSGAYGFSIENINVSYYTSLTLEFGYKKESASGHATFSVDYWNGSAWITLANTASALFNESATASALWYLSKTLSLPTDAQINSLKIRFVKTGTIAIRIDDVKLNGVETLPTVTTTSVDDITHNSATFAGNVSATGGTTITATGTVYSVTSVNANPVLGGTGVTALSTSNPNSGVGSFSKSSGTTLLSNVQYSYSAYATKSTGLSGYGTVNSFYTLAAVPAAPIVGSASATSLSVAIGNDTNSSSTTYAIYETTTGSYVQNNGTLGTTAVYLTAASWGTKTLTGLNPLTNYTFNVTAKNGSGIITSAGSTTSVSTLAIPTLTTSGTLSSLSTTYGTASAFTTFLISGTHLTDNATVSAPSGFEISQTAGGLTGYAVTQSVVPVSGTINTLTIYVRLAKTAVYGTHSGNINLTSLHDGLETSIATASSSVSKLDLTIGGVAVLNKTYDATVNATLTGTPVLKGLLTSDLSSVSLITSAVTASFVTADIGTSKAVTVAGYSLNGSASINYNLLQPTGLTADIIPNAISDIAFNSGSPTSTNSNIEYVLYQGTTLTNTSNGAGGSAGVMGFYLRDGGAGLNDADNLGTQLTSITFTVTNSSCIRSARLFVGNAAKGVPIAVNGASTIVFSGLTDIIANDNTSLAINLRVTFNSSVTDNQQMQFTISSATSASTGSGFATANAGGAISSVSNNYNRIEVVADRMIFVQQPPLNTLVGAFMSPSPSVMSVDVNGNEDLDFNGSVSITSSGALSNSPQTAVASNGLAVFTGISFTSVGTGVTLTANSSVLQSVVSNVFTITPLTLVTPTFTPIDPICAGGTITALPTTSNNGYTGTWSPALNNMATTIYTFTPNANQNATSVNMTIVVNPNITPTFTAISPIPSGGSLSPLPTNSNNGISGSWSPALNTTQTTTYTFVPSAGQCATLATLTIVVLTNGGTTAVSNTENYIKTTTYREPNGNNPVTSITYFDGLGRPMQRIDGKKSNSGKDIVTPITYDDYGRQEKEYLPYASSQSNLSFISDTNTLTGAMIAQYQTKYGDTNPYSQKQFEASPLNRVLKQAAPGNDWALGSGHEIKFDYQTNVANEVKLYKADDNVAGNTVNLINGSGTVYYDPNQLYKNITTDENNNSTEEFKDKEGRVVMKRVYGKSVVGGNEISTWHETYYVYDQYGNLSFVIPPLVTMASGQMEDLCYQYKYDYRNRLIEKKLPGKQWEFMVYDKLDRVVATGPAFTPFSNQSSGWMITKYDAFNRVVYTGWEDFTATTSTRANKQSDQNGLTSFSESKLSSSSTIDGIAINYSNTVLPTSFKLLTVNYYDDYNFPDAPTIPSTVEGDTVYYNNTIKPKGLATGTWVRALTSSSAPYGLLSYTLYDQKGRVIRQHTQNHMGGFTQVDSKLKPITGVTDYTVTTHSLNNTTNSTVVTVRDNFVYDTQDRLLFHTSQVDGGVVNLIAKNDYDELGQLVVKNVGGTDVSSYEGLQKVDYTYNIRGWLKGINTDGNGDPALNDTPKNDLFAFKINYNTVQNETNYTGVSLYNGNISETYWMTSNDSQMKKYGYFYDELNRLKNAVYQEPGSSAAGGVVPEYYNESLQYDKNGNITRLMRNGGQSNYLPANQIDDLTYTYNGAASNRLLSVNDGYLGNADGGFIDGANVTNEYDYDDNGNMTKDLNKGITVPIEYNHLNLPTKIQFANGGLIAYLYDAQGKKLEKRVTQGATTTTTTYLDGFQYVNDVLQFFPHNEGYVKKTGNGFVYVYNYTDHLGNVRLSYSDADQSGIITPGEVLEENNYYPFGLKHAPNNGNNGQPDYKYKYQGQERQDELGLNWDSFKWRNYDYAIGRFMSIDPLAEKYAYNSPYAFQENKMGMGRELEGLELFSPWLNVAVSTSSPITSTPLLGTSDAVKIGVDVGGKASEVGGKTEVHHVIPRAAKGSDVVRAARDEGFKFEGSENKMPVDKFSKATGEGQHGNHPSYNKGVLDKLGEFTKTPDGPSAVEFVRGLVKDLKETIKNNPDTKINDILKSTVPVKESTKVPLPDIVPIAKPEKINIEALETKRT